MTSAQGSKEEIKPEAVGFKPRGVNGNCWKMKGDVGLNCAIIELISNYNTVEETHDLEVNVVGCADDLSGFGCANDPGYNTVEEARDLEVNVLGCADDSSGFGLTNDPDATEYSSSFGNTISCSDDGLNLSSSDVEVGSQLRAENAAFAFSDGFSRVIRKKKMTGRWRRFIRPLMWRCKWLELRMKELHAQALKYEKELLAYDEEKILKVEIADKSASRWQAMRRQRRKRNEEIIDISSYMSNHNIFSYYDGGYKADGLSLSDGCENQGEQKIKHPKDSNEWPMLDFRDDDSPLEYILLNIESLKSRIFRMKVETSNMLSGFSAEISNSSLCVPIKPPYSPTLSPTCSSDNEVSSYGDPSCPDIIEFTMDLLSSAVGLALDQQQLGGLTDDVILVNNQAAEEELQYFKNVCLPIEKPEDTVKEKILNISPAVSTSETESDKERFVMPEFPVLEICSHPNANIRRGKRKRVQRKLSRCGWNGEKIQKLKSVSTSETESDAERLVMPKFPVLERCSHPDANIRRSKRKRRERILSPGGWNGEKIQKRKSSKALKKPFV